jgi:hypothetical protein
LHDPAEAVQGYDAFPGERVPIEVRHLAHLAVLQDGGAREQGGAEHGEGDGYGLHGSTVT